MTGLEIVVLVAVSFVGLFAVWVHGYSRGEIAGRYAAEREQRIRNLGTPTTRPVSTDLAAVSRSSSRDHGYHARRVL